MPEYDGSIRINTEIITGNAKKDFKQLQDEINKVKSATAGGETNKELDELISKVKEYKKELNELYKNGQEESDQYNETAAKWREAKEAVDDYMRSNMNLSEITETFKRQLEDLKANGYGFGDEQYDTVYKAWKNATIQEKEYAKQLNEDTLENKRKLEESNEIKQNAIVSDEKIVELMKKLTALEARRAELKKAGVTQGYEEYDQISEKIKQIKDEVSGKNAKELAEEERLAQIRKEAVVSDQRTVDIVKELTALEARRAELKKAGVTQGYKEYDETTQRIKEIKEELSESGKKFEETGKKAKKSMKDVSDSTKNTTGLLGKFLKKIKSIAITTFIFMQVRKAFRQMVAALKEGFNNLVIYSDEYNKTMSALKSSQTQLKNSINAAFGPVIDIAVKGLTNLINYIIKATNAMGQFIAMLTGASTWTKALAVQEDYAKSLDKTGASAKKAAKSLAGFDKLNVLNNKDSGDADEIDPKSMFTEEAIDSQNFKVLDKIKEKIEEIAEIFKKGFTAGLGDNITNQLYDILQSAKSIWKSLKDIFTNDYVVKAANQTFEKIVYSFGQTTGAIVSIATTLSQLIVGGISKFLDQNKEFLKEKIVNIFNVTGEIAELIGNTMEAIADIFTVFGSDSAKQIVGDFIAVVSDGLLAIVEISLKLFKDIGKIFLKPFIDNKEKIKEVLQGLIDTVSRFTTTIKKMISDILNKINNLYDQHISTFFNSITEGISLLLDSFLNFWQNNLKPILNEWADKFDDLWKNTLKPFIDNIIDNIGFIIDDIKILWERVLVPLIDWIITNILPVLLPIFDTIYNAVLEIIAGITEVLDGLITFIKGLIEFIVGVFTGDWEKAWNGIADIVQGVGDTIKGIINAIIGFVESLINGVIKTINKVIDLINSIGSIEIPEIFGGGKLGINIPHVNTVAIPRLADGDVIRGGNPFIAMLGDQRFGQTNIETPVPTMIDAFKTALREEGYNKGTYTFIAEIDGNTVFEKTVELNKLFYDATGRSAYEV